MTLDPPEVLRHNAEVVTSILSDVLTRVSTPGHVLGFIQTDGDEFVALKGNHVTSAEVVGRYSTYGLALEAVRLRKRSL
ncbi:hypothetical protein [Frondihabitans cladoniiphilus]|uniref:hypothetical protein n=1 Tax=Frondihabitans cladoniiphilus TaxID=715785 RepID=UPI0031F13A48